MFYKKVFLKISQNLQENTCTIDFVTGVFLWILWHFWECLFSKTQLGDCFWSLTLGRDYRTKRFDLILSTKNFSLTLLTKCRHIFFSIWVFFYEHSRITGLQRKGEGISLTYHYHFHRFTGAWALAGRLLRGAHLCA